VSEQDVLGTCHVAQRQGPSRLQYFWCSDILVVTESANLIFRDLRHIGSLGYDKPASLTRRYVEPEIIPLGLSNR